MTAIIKNRFRHQNAQDFLENFQPVHSIERNHYLFVGRARAWPSQPLSVPPVSDLLPPMPLDTYEEERRIWESMLGLKKISEIQTSLVIPRYDWNVDTIYVPFDDADTNLYRHPTDLEVTQADLQGAVAGTFYVLTSDLHLFVCIENGRGSKSTVQPTYQPSGYSDSRDVDGYRWKYMTTITPLQVVRFLSDSWIPVKTVGYDDGSRQWDVENSAVDGELLSISLTTLGGGYQHIHDGTLQSATSDTAQLAAGASATTQVYTGAVIHIVDGLGAGQVRKIVDYDTSGGNRIITVSPSFDTTPDATSIYEIRPEVVITGNGSGATAKAEVVTDAGADQYKIKRILITNPGADYTHMTASIPSGSAGGSGAVLRPIIAPPGGLGKNIELQLGAFFVMTHVRLEYQEGEGDFPISNDYRQIGMIRDVRDFASGDLSTAETLTASKRLLLSAVVSGPGGAFRPDENIVGTLGGNSATGQTIELLTGPGAGEGTLAFYQDTLTGYNDFVDGMTVTGQISGAQGVIKTSGVLPEEIRKNTGEILTLENRRPILRSPDQIEDIKIITEF